MRKDFTKFVNQLRFDLKQSLLSQNHKDHQELSYPIQDQNHLDETVLPPPPRQGKHCGPLYNSKPTNNRNLELFIDNRETDLFNPKS